MQKTYCFYFSIFWIVNIMLKSLKILSSLLEPRCFFCFFCFFFKILFHCFFFMSKSTCLSSKSLFSQTSSFYCFLFQDNWVFMIMCLNLNSFFYLLTKFAFSEFPLNVWHFESLFFSLFSLHQFCLM